jgi:hypothetical protein
MPHALKVMQPAVAATAGQQLSLGASLPLLLLLLLLLLS